MGLEIKVLPFPFRHQTHNQILSVLKPGVHPDSASIVERVTSGRLLQAISRKRRLRVLDNPKQCCDIQAGVFLTGILLIGSTGKPMAMRLC